jgi:hypothetical protein
MKIRCLSSIPSAFDVRRSAFVLPIACCFLFSLPLHAEVFWRIPKHADTALQQLGGIRVYSTAVLLNGSPGSLSAYSIGASAAETRAGLARLLGLPSDSAFGGALVTHAEKNRVRRFFVLPAASGDSTCVVLLFDQSAADYTRALQTPAAWPDGLPAVTGDLRFSAVCAETRTAFAVAETLSAPEDAVQEASQNLANGGWALVSSAATPTFKMFSSGRKVCLLFAARASKSDKTVISVLQREGAAP